MGLSPLSVDRWIKGSGAYQPSAVTFVTDNVLRGLCVGEGFIRMYGRMYGTPFRRLIPQLRSLRVAGLFAAELGWAFFKKRAGALFHISAGAA